MHIKSALIGSALTLLIAGTASWAATVAPYVSDLGAARQGLTDAIKHTRAADDGPIPQGIQSHLKKALAFMELASEELDSAGLARPLSN